MATGQDEMSRGMNKERQNDAAATSNGCPQRPLQSSYNNVAVRCARPRLPPMLAHQKKAAARRAELLEMFAFALRYTRAPSATCSCICGGAGGGAGGVKV